jgi:hypothetical protein
MPTLKGTRSLTLVPAPARADDQLTRNLRQANRRLLFWLDSLVLNERCQAATPQQMAGLLSDLMRAGEWLRAGLPEEKDLELEAELEQYRQNVEKLRELLPSIHRQLLSERGRLEAERARIGSAAEWMRAARQTL